MVSFFLWKLKFNIFRATVKVCSLAKQSHYNNLKLMKLEVQWGSELWRLLELIPYNIQKIKKNNSGKEGRQNKMYTFM